MRYLIPKESKWHNPVKISGTVLSVIGLIITVLTFIGVIGYCNEWAFAFKTDKQFILGISSGLSVYALGVVALTFVTGFSYYTDMKNLLRTSVIALISVLIMLISGIVYFFH